MKPYQYEVLRQRIFSVFCILIILLTEALCIQVLYFYIFNIASKNTKNMIILKNTKNNICDEMLSFPIPKEYQMRIYFEDSYNADRTTGKHDGCDIMDSLDKAGEIPVVSCTNGKITNIGWLYLGGYRIGITSDSGTYYYYAHLSSYEKSLKLGDEVYAGQFIGFMGNTGEGEEGTSGKFPTHLHFGIYRFQESEKGINPYEYLMKLFKNE